MKTKFFAALAIATLALAGCSDSTDAKGTEATKTAGTSLRGEYKSVDELKAAATEAGYKCVSWTPGDWNQGTCSEKDFFGVFPNKGSRSAYMHKAEAAGESFTALVGDNWYIAGEEADLTALEGKLKGKITKVEGAPQATETAK
ncbi:hypothetical protein INS90_00795 [Trueperella pecoris]|uniref:Lipoprotein n=1 Tax=Trueperella pecoris TaxID=2733571 RepID=A0A7M1R160_9ACTO|nr:hypothetical protein [Trueperella pecoris]QOR47886.1 hypothetical protein INS90_00795 [Trueperella pecoris]